MIIAMTGTRRGMTAQQRVACEELLLELGATVLVHGNAVGADADAHDAAGALSIPRHVWPSTLTSAQRQDAQRGPADVWHDAKPPLERNRDIVDEGRILLAFPRPGYEELRSGTWAAVRYARRVGKPVIIVWPGGDTTRERGWL